MEKQRSSRNKTLTVTPTEYTFYKGKLQFEPEASFNVINELVNKTFCADSFKLLDKIPSNSVDLIFLDPPYNMDKDFNGFKFSKMTDENYFAYLQSWFPKLVRILKDSGTLYFCGDWKNSNVIYSILKKHLLIRNRIVWQREKGRGSETNWKNVAEDIWYSVKSENFYFDANSVKQKKTVIAPYKENGIAKDWQETEDGKFRLTYPSNFMNDLTVPYWSMSENTDHPTQKPEKLLAKLILASCPENGIVLDPFLGSGTTSVVAKKLNRNYIGIEFNEEYCVWAEKRLELANTNNRIQGYENGVFLERNAAEK
ncbi:MAG: site-specific DNA-methyltransferase [Clostridia bacterium]|nr:site-specific DNA-methyltransferase [Clostridia bacterium]